MLEREGYIIWPSYIDKELSRRLGRRISRRLSLISPRAEEIAKAARKLGFEAYVEEGAYPRVWWKKEKKVIVKAEGVNKKELLRMIAKKVAELRNK